MTRTARPSNASRPRKVSSVWRRAVTSSMMASTTGPSAPGTAFRLIRAVNSEPSLRSAENSPPRPMARDSDLAAKAARKCRWAARNRGGIKSSMRTLAHSSAA